MSARYAIGVDLGTTNCTVGYVALEGQEAVRSLDVEQTSAPAEHVTQALLPSFLYLATDDEAPLEPREAGVIAKARASVTPGRVVASAKSWLCHTGVDRRGAILPFGSDDDDLQKLSPVDVSAHYLAHLGRAWQSAHPDATLNDQRVVLTVPASFDAVARELTREAARAAGFPDDLRLLEEPQAALYAWLAARGDAWRKLLSTGDALLVVDIGGGTTDFSLIKVLDDDGQLGLERVAVGEHILLGGDNMDLALAYALAQTTPALADLSDWQMRALTHACRAAKERLLSSDDDAHPVAVPGRGRRLVQSTLSGELTRELVERVVLEGFFPACEINARPTSSRRAGLASMGLPYATDAAITRHLAAFLSDAGVTPSAVLFNGGVTHAPVIQQRVTRALTSWFGDEVRVLDGGHKDLAVARGAASYAKISATGGLRIKGGTARAYYVGVERAELAIPGVPPRVDALCVAPLGMEEGSEVTLDEVLGLYRGERAIFRFFSSTERAADQVGDKVAPAELVEIAPVELNIAGDDDAPVPVKLRARVSEIGTLEFAAVEELSGHPHELSFDVRGDG